MGPGPTNPGFVTCGSTQCDLTTQICCALSASGPTCIATSQGLSACPGENTVACDEPEDCPAGQICGVVANNPLWTRCTTATYEPMVCKTNADCGDAGGGICVTMQSCNHHSVYVSTCGVDGWCKDFP
jgi:hypothetical protein